tara:strand:+ start:155 stop:1186 length:1032 start_codon:yes stop_codon:yes gene_type:complete
VTTTTCAPVNEGHWDSSHVGYEVGQVWKKPDLSGDCFQVIDADWVNQNQFTAPDADIAAVNGPGYVLGDEGNGWKFVKCCPTTPKYGTTTTTVRVGDPRFGCTNPNAINHDPFATVDDGSCIILPRVGCTDPKAKNFDPFAVVDDGSCEFDPEPPDIPVWPPEVFKPEPPWKPRKPVRPEPPYVPALCRKPPVNPPGELELDHLLGESQRSSTEGSSAEGSSGDVSYAGNLISHDGSSDQHEVPNIEQSPVRADPSDIQRRVNIEQQGNNPPPKIFPAAINALQEPFYSDINFNTNITKKTPTPYGFTTTPPDDVVVTEFESEITAGTTICPPDNENCNTLQY